jgi:CRP-like cAMP-binding protein
MKKQDAIEIIRSTDTFRNMPANLIDKLAQSAGCDYYDQDCLLVRPNQPWENLCFVMSGFIQARQRTASGVEANAIPVQKGVWVSWNGVFGTPAANIIRREIWVSENSQLLTIPCSKIREACQEWPQLYVQIIEEINYLFYLMHDLLWFNHLLTGAKRVGRAILYQNAVSAFRDSKIIEVTQERLAQTLNISRQTLSLHLQELQQQKFIEVGYGRLKILDPEGLKEHTKI